MRKDGRFLHVLLVSVLAAALPLRTNCKPPARQSRSSANSLRLSAIEDVLSKTRRHAPDTAYSCQDNQPPTTTDLRNVIKGLVQSGTPPYAIIELVVDALKLDQQVPQDGHIFAEDGTKGIDGRNLALPFWLNRYANHKREDQVDRSRGGSDVTNPWFEIAREETPLYRELVRSSLAAQEDEDAARERAAEELELLLVEVEEIQEHEQEPEQDFIKTPQRFPPVAQPSPFGNPPGFSPGIPQRVSPGIPHRLPPGISPPGLPSSSRPGLYSQGSRGRGPPNQGLPPGRGSPPGNVPFSGSLPPHQEELNTFHQPASHSELGPPMVEIPPTGVDILVRAHVPDETYATRISLSPMMSVYDALYQAGIEYDTQSTDHNPFDFGIGTLEARECYIVDSMGELSTDDDFQWVITVVNEHGKILWNNVCLPDPSDLLRNGFTIQLDYVLRAVAPPVEYRPVAQGRQPSAPPPVAAAPATAAAAAAAAPPGEPLHPNDSSTPVHFSPCSHHTIATSATGHLRLNPVLSSILQFLFCHHYNSSRKT